MSTSNAELLGLVIVDEMLRIAAAGKKMAIDFGSIGGSLELIPNQLEGPVPDGEYTICRAVSGEEIGKTEDGEKVYAKKLKAGDRVLICCCGTELIVVDVLG